MDAPGSLRFRHPVISLVVFAALSILAAFLASLAQSDFGRLDVRNVRFANEAGRNVRAKLLAPKGADSPESMPGVVYIHGYQNNRETSDPYAIELARRGFVVLEIDALGRGNSDIPGDEGPGFDGSYGGRAAVAWLRGLPSVDPGRVGIMGHSLGAEMAYTVALEDPSIAAISFSGFGYTMEADKDRPRNMLMIFGKYDEYRKRMTGTSDFMKEFMSSPQTLKVFSSASPEIGKTYGDFDAGTARMVYATASTHVMESHDQGAVATAVEWMRSSLAPDPRLWIDPGSQLWPLKETCTLVAMLACFAAVLPLADLLLRGRLFSALARSPTGTWVCGRKEYWRLTGINTLLAWLYLPLVLTLFGLHLYVVRIDRVFPLMMANGIIFWFLVTNVIGLLLFRGWRRKRAVGLSLYDAGLSHAAEGLRIDGKAAATTIAFSLLLFLAAVAFEAILEGLLIVDFRFIFPFANDLPAARIPLVPLYLPFLFVGFLGNGVFLHTQLRPFMEDSGWRVYFRSWGRSAVAVVLPLFTILLVQYVPLFAGGSVPFVGPGAALVGFVINLYPIILKLVVATAFSSFLFLKTGSVYPGALLNALVVAWMFSSSQVIAPIPV